MEPAAGAKGLKSLLNSGIISLLPNSKSSTLLLLSTGLNGVLVSLTVFKTARDLRARSAGFDSQAVPPIKHFLPLLHKFACTVSSVKINKTDGVPISETVQDIYS